MTLISILAVGVLVGMKHATEADHLAAVATLATRHGTLPDALRQGAAWGLGHTLTLILFGGVALVLGRSIPEGVALFLEMIVGLMLIGLGADVLRRLWRRDIHFHAHAHGDGVVHLHAHRHAEHPRRGTTTTPAFAQMQFTPLAGPGHRSAPHEHPHATRLPRRAILVGMMHGLAGSAALIVLSLGATPTAAMGLLYILAFGVGSIAGMALLSMVIVLPLRASALPAARVHRGITAAVGLFSCVLGLWVVYRTSILEGLMLG